MTEAYITLATNDNYGNGAYVLGKSLRNSKTSKRLVVIVTAGLSAEKRAQLTEVWDQVVEVEHMDSSDEANLALLKRPELGCTLTKLRAWQMTEFSKCVFLDADTMILQNIDDLFERDQLSAVPDVGWPDCFNSGLFVFRPNKDTYLALLHHAKQFGSFDGGDQGLLNDFFPDWHRLPFIYNTVASSAYSYLPAFKRYGHSIKVVHFLGALKPWHHHFDEASQKVILSGSCDQTRGDQIFTQMWWDLFKSQSGGEAWNVWSKHAGRAARTPETAREEWESGRPDYEGEDRFDSIITYMSAMMLSSKPDSTAQQAAAVSESQDKKVDKE